MNNFYECFHVLYTQKLIVIFKVSDGDCKVKLRFINYDNYLASL